MSRITFSQLIAGALVSLCLATVPARALNDHTYVSGKGTTAGTCNTPATACRTFAFAIGQTADPGTIIAIDAANYGPVTITKPISILADGDGPAGIFISTGTAITILVTGVFSTSNVVNLRGLTLDGAGTASTGIASIPEGSHGPSLIITDCFIRDFNGDGVALGGAGVSDIYISNTVSSDNKGSGLSIAQGLVHQGFVDHFTASGDSIGIDVVGSSFPSTGSDVTIVNSVMERNDAGLLVGGSAGATTVRLAGSVVISNGTDVNISASSTAFS